MTLLTATVGTSESVSSNDTVRLLKQDDILASITKTSSVLNATAALRAWQHEKQPGRLNIYCYPPVIERSVAVRTYTMSTLDWNAIALSRVDEEITKHLDKRLEGIFEVAPPMFFFTSSHCWYNWLRVCGILILSVLPFLIATTLLGSSLSISVLAVKKLGGFFFAAGAGAYVVNLIIKEARMRGLLPLQKKLLYTAAFLLTYELWILFSIASNQLR